MNTEITKDFVLALFSNFAVIDSTTIALAVTRRTGSSYQYKRERGLSVLKQLKLDGLVYEDAQGWWHKVTPTDAPAQ